MKKYKFNILLLALVLLFTQCYKDNSNTEIRDINPIEIDNSVQEQTISVNQMDVIHVSPMVFKNGVEDESLTYRWELTGQGIIPTVLGDKMTLHAVVAAPTSSENYTLTLTVTDSETQIQNFATYYVKVESNFANGLVVADTHDGGLTSDLSLIRAENFSSNYDIRKNRIFKDLYSSVNQTKFPGKVTGLTTTTCYTGSNRLLSVFSDDHIARVDPYDFAIKDQNQELFYTAISSEIKPKKIAFIDNSNGTNCINLDGKIYIHNLRFASKYAAQFTTSDNSAYRIGKMSDSGLLDQNTWQAEFPFLFDELNGRILQIDKYCQKITVFDDIYTGSAFDFNRLKDIDVLFMGRGQSANNKAIHMVAKNKNNNKYYCYVFDIAEPKPLFLYDLNGCENIQNAVAYECNPREDIFYYATSNGIYSTQMSNGNITKSKKCYTPKAGEEITNMKLWRARGWAQGKVRITDSNESAGYARIDALNNMLIISTYNQATKEGKIITIGIPNLGAGELELNPKYHTEYGGFGEIVEFDHQSV